MLHVDITLCDSRIMATRDIPKSGVWSTYLMDNQTGQSMSIELTDNEIAAIVAVALSGDGTAGQYDIAEDVMQRFKVPACLRPIP